MTFASSLEQVVAWRGTRFPWPRFLALAGLLAWAALSAGGASAASAAAAFLLALTLVAQFRLWDDLVDRSSDREAHPERVIARSITTAPFERCVCLLAAANAIALFGLYGAHAAIGLLSLSALAALWYRAHRGRGLAHVLILHLKYPAFVLLLAPAAARPFAGAVIVYAALVGFELLDGAAATRARHLPFALASLGLALVTFGGGR